MAAPNLQNYGSQGRQGLTRLSEAGGYGYTSSPFKVTRKISIFLSALSVPLRFKSNLFNHRDAENTELRD
ncbi:hypothetical protein [Nostoc sp. 'Peltigera malacea cyanobiont' DB3992]|uniref:hypothetical protein n=1 Tax=Nostoc sp. 'Peltigera malacea cyanobiont' DB3992 TaxID=1206980 RepID=UPI0015D4996C|nr:hypothetical protein [Nostoc sp. 'Peltigera malacea cyanobiont' DB3992]